MLDRSDEDKLSTLYDMLFDQLLDLEQAIRSLPLDEALRHRFGQTLTRILHDHVTGALSIVGEEPEHWGRARRDLIRHPLFCHLMENADLLRIANSGAPACTGQATARRMICAGDAGGGPDYTRLLNGYFLNLPAATAFRMQGEAMVRQLRALPDGARVLAPACGQAPEIETFAAEPGPALTIDLMDCDADNHGTLSGRIQTSQVRSLLGTPADLIKGRRAFSRTGIEGRSRSGFRLPEGGYDLIFSAGLYDCLPTFPMNPTRGTTGLTRRLFACLKPGGRLVIGNFLKPVDPNPHGLHHQFMIETYAGWRLHYRSAEEVRGFADTLPAGGHQVRLVDESLSRPVFAGSVMAFLVIERTA